MRKVLFGFKAFGVYKQAETSQTILAHEVGRNANMDILVIDNAGDISEGDWSSVCRNSSGWGSNWAGCVQQHGDCRS